MFKCIVSNGDLTSEIIGQNLNHDDAFNSFKGVEWAEKLKFHRSLLKKGQKNEEPPAFNIACEERNDWLILTPLFSDEITWNVRWGQWISGNHIVRNSYSPNKQPPEAYLREYISGNAHFLTKNTETPS